MSITRRIGQLERCDPEMFGDLIVTCQTPYLQGVVKTQAIKPVPYTMCLKKVGAIVRPPVEKETSEGEKRRASILVDELLLEIYCAMNGGCSGYNSTSGKSCRSTWVEAANLEDKGIQELERAADRLRLQLGRMCDVLVRRLKRRDALRLQQETFCDVINERLFLIGEAKNNLTDMRFTIQPLPGDTGFSQWVAAMKMVAQLQGGIPSEFRKRLWLTMADKHLAAKGVDWPKVERTCFSEWSHPADAELGVQIVKDLHRTGCSLFCGKDGQENQVLLKRVLLAYARWNKSVGYCQGFNMLAALILQVTDKCESEALKLMIYLIEGVLPDSYFADSLRGLSVDMAAFRELLRTKLPKLSKHLDRLQTAAKDGNRSYEPPLTNVFTMQWFLTLFCNCLPQPTVLRVWDLIFLEGNEILLRTALAIWQVLEEKILGARSADEFYCLMGALTREILEFDLIDANSLVKAVVVIGPLTELDNLREHYLYNINPWGKSLSPVVDKQLKVYSKQSMALDISALKKQYDKLKQRQRQAHIIFSAAITRQPPPAPPVTINHLLLGKSALVPAKRLGPVRGSIPPPAQPPQPPPLPRQAPSTLHWKDAQKNSSSSSSSDTELCDEDTASSSDDEPEQTRFDDNLRINVVDTTATDNTPSAKSSAEVELDVASQTDSSDFEQFLADRVKYLGSPTEEAAEEKINYARRNSERALQIIQENSMILHRIMQCQSRFSPSPPLDDKAGSCSYSTKEIDTTITTTIPIESEELSPYKSKYTSILEKSKSLDEKYNALILNVQQKQPLLGALKNKSDSALPKFSLGPTDESAESNKSFKYVDSDADINSQQGCDTSIREFKYKIDDSKYLHLENYPTPTSFSYENTDTIISPECDEKYRLPIKEFEKFYTISPEGSIQSPGNTEANPSHFSFETEQTQFESDFTSKNSPTEKSIEIPLSPQEILNFSTKRSNFTFTTKEVSLFASQHSPYESSQSSAPSYETEKVSEFNYNFDVSPITTSEYNHEQFSPKSTQNSPSNLVTSNFKFIHTDALFSDNPSYSLEELAKELVSPGVEDLDLVSQNLPFRSIFEEERELSPKDQPLPFSIETSEQNVSSIEEQSPTTFMKEHSQKFVPPQSLTVDSYDFPSSSGDSDYFSNRSPSKLVSSLESVQSPPLSLTTRSNFLYDLPCSSIDTSRRFVSSFETTSPPSESKLDPSASYGDSMDKKLLMKTRSLSPSTLVRVEGGSPSPVDARTCYNFPEERLKPLNLAPFSISPLKSLKSPSRSPAKSPDQPFNPFPVAISTRQNKEVPLKLGMYKK